MTLPTCQEIHDFLADYIHQELPAEARAEFDRHLKCCPCCVNYLKSYRTTLELVQETRQPATFPPLPVELKTAILAARNKVS